MKKLRLEIIIVVATLFFIISGCNLKSKSTDDTAAVLKPQEQPTETSKVDTAKIIALIEQKLQPSPVAAGGNKTEINSRTIKFYNDSNKDTTLVMIQVKGTTIMNKSIPNAGPDKPYEGIEKWKLFKVNGILTAFKN
jgi:hypothetical protein